MDQTQDQMNRATGFALLESGKRIAFIRANWHREIVDQAYHAFCETCAELGIEARHIDVFDVPGSLEIPLHAKLLARGGEHALIVAAGLIVDGGIYRHDFVAATVLDAMMQVQLQFDTPLLSVVLTPHHFQESEAHRRFFFDHFRIKGAEAAQACAQTLVNLEKLAETATGRAA